MRAKAVEAYRLLNDYVGDLVAGTRSLELFETSPLFANVSDSMRVVLRRMCLSHLVVTLSKWGEVYDRYRDVFPDDILQLCCDLRKELDRRGVRNFRNTVVGHIWDKKLRRTLTVSEVESRLRLVIGDDLALFRAWINNPVRNDFPHTVVAVCERIRDRLGEQHGLGSADLSL
ncbi:MAG TPA: hypothetical protein VN494_01425 [Patescibacteria group bacterium]|nr:hypothetical protein [Patescibacteria group bacterium]